MKHTKREWIPLYNFLDRTRLTAHLSEMAGPGLAADIHLLLELEIPPDRAPETEIRCDLFCRSRAVLPRPGTGAGHLPGLLRPGRMAGRRQHGSGAGLLQRG